MTDYLNRGYWEPGMNKALLGLYIGYFRSQRTGATIHSPKNCLPGAGWNPAQSSVYQLPLDDGRKVPINLYLIRKGLESEVVLYWYQSHGRVVASEYWGKFYLVYDALRLNRTDAALVRITVPVRTATRPRPKSARFPSQNKLQVISTRSSHGEPRRSHAESLHRFLSLRRCWPSLSSAAAKTPTSPRRNISKAA